MLPPDKAVADVCKDNEVLTVSLQVRWAPSIDSIPD